MKRLSLIIMFAVLAMFVKAQPAPTNLINYKGLENKLEKSNEAIQNPKKNTDPKTWFSRGELFLEIYSVNLQHLRKGMSASEVKIYFGQPDQVQMRTEEQKNLEEYIYERITITLDAGLVISWEETKKIHEDPLSEAQKAFLKAIELDVNNKLSNKIKEGLVKLKQYFEIEGVNAFNNKNFQQAYTSFNNILKTNELPVMEGLIDTLVIYTVGRAAKEAGHIETALQLFNKTLELKYDDPFIYIYMNSCYEELGDSLKALEILQTGFKKHPEDQAILVELINYFLEKGRSEVAIDYIQLAKKADPQNVSFIFTEGALFDKIGKTDDAIAAYKLCLAIDPNYYNAQFNLGVVYYNKAVKMIEDAQKIEAIEVYNKMMHDAGDEFLKAVPYMEAAKNNASDSNKCEVLSTLKILYYRLKEEEKRDKAAEEMTMLGCQ